MDSIHFFQRFSQAENVATNNTLLLLSRLYQYSPFKFKAFINELLEDNEIQAGVVFKQQQRSKNTIPDGYIGQDSFKVVIETKLHSAFDINQLIGHCDSFENEDAMILLSLCPGNISSALLSKVQSEIDRYNKKNKKHIRHYHVTFEKIIECCRNVVDVSDFEFTQIIDDYEAYCFHDGLIDNSDGWMRVVTCGWTFEDNMKYSLYYDLADRGYSEHGYIGIYKEKSVRGIGKIVNIVTADIVRGKVKVIESQNPVSEEQLANIKDAAISGKQDFGWDINRDHKFFIVDKFYETDFKKKSKYPLIRSKFFNLKDLLKTDKLPDVQVIAEKLKHLDWDSIN